MSVDIDRLDKRIDTAFEQINSIKAEGCTMGELNQYRIEQIEMNYTDIQKKLDALYKTLTNGWQMKIDIAFKAIIGLGVLYVASKLGLQ